MNLETNQLNRKSTVYTLLFIIIFLSVFIRIILALGPMNYYYELGWRTIHSRMIAQDLEENNFDIFNTKVYCQGEKVNYVQAFPLYKLLIVPFYKIFGENHIIGRIVSIICFMFALIIFFFVARYFLTEYQSLLAVTLLSFNYLYLSFTYQFQPTSLDLLLIMIVLYFFLKNLNSEKNLKSFIYMAIAFNLLAITKITYAAFLAVPVIFTYFSKYKFSILKLKRYWIFAFVTLLLNYGWYYYALSKTYYRYQASFVSYFTDIYNWVVVEGRWYLLKRIYSEGWNNFLASVSIAGFILIIIGVIHCIKQKNYFIPGLFTSYSLLWLIIPDKYQVHPYNFTTLLIPGIILLVKGINVLYISVLKIKVGSYTPSSHFRKTLFALAMLYLSGSFIFSNLIIFRSYHRYNFDYIIPIGRQIREATDKEDKIGFFNSFVSTNNIWLNQYSLQTKRPGWPLDFKNSFTPKKIIHFLNLGATKLAIINEIPYRNLDEYPQEMRTTYNWLYTTFPYLDGFYNHYTLFDLSKMNKYELKNNEVPHKNLWVENSGSGSFAML